MPLSPGVELGLGSVCLSLGGCTLGSGASHHHGGDVGRLAAPGNDGVLLDEAGAHKNRLPGCRSAEREGLAPREGSGRHPAAGQRDKRAAIR